MEEEVMKRKNMVTRKRGFDGESWQESEYKKTRTEMLTRDMSSVKDPVVYSEAEHDKTSLWESAVGHAGKVVEVERFGLGQGDHLAGCVSEGRKKVKRLLYKMQLSGPEQLTSSVFHKVEAGIPARRLWPVDLASSDVLSWVERAFRKSMEQDAYTMVNKNLGFVVSQ
jgi:hypothetical protein